MKLLNRPKLLQVKERDEYIALQWSHLERATALFAQKLQKLEEFDTLLVLVRGGLAPAACLAHRLNKRNLIFLQGMKTGSNKPHDYKKLSVSLLPKVREGEKIVIVEDIIFEGDTAGKAIEYVHAKRGGVVAVCALVADENFLQKKAFGNSIPFVIAHQCKHLKWIRFPWERKIRNEVTPKTK